ncbi:aquaporin-5-like, partial [Symsagittifera roscoffensis]|uniref:aquaporin-5-like n=1 Tax=Symsagittifera roscoffensis TaxID=84072 RepID=UPI00307BBC1B
GVLAILVALIGPVSGCYLNPAVTISMLLIRRCSIVQLLFYLPAQLTGSIAASGLAYWTGPDDWVEQTNLGATRLAPGVSWTKGLVIEFVATCFLILVVMVVSKPEPDKFEACSTDWKML